MEPLVLVWVFALGAAVGSFANVCIHRLPRGESVVSPPSRCPGCGRRISWFDNVPIVSWLVLRGRCRSCSAPISPRYLAVELVVALSFGASYVLYGASLAALTFAVLFTSAVILVVTDVTSRCLPEPVTLGTLALGIALAAARDALDPRPFSFAGSALLQSLAGALAGGLLLWLVREAYFRLRGVEGMGFGDVEMIAMIGALTGPAGVFLTLLLGSLLGSATGLYMVLSRAVVFARARARAKSGVEGLTAAAAHGLALDAQLRVHSAGRRFREIPGAAESGRPLAESGPAARPLVAFVRLARRRARKGLRTSYGRLILEEGEGFFRVLAASAERTGDTLLVLMSRADIPFGFFLAVGSTAAFVIGRRLLGLLVPGLEIPGDGLLP